MSERILNWALLSTAAINRAVITPLRMSSRNRLMAVASREQERAQAYAATWGIPRAYGSYEAVLADPGIDVVYVSLPNGMHAEWAVKAAEAGKHVLCEKPIAVSVEEVDAIRAAAKRAGVIVAEAFMYRHHALTLKVQEMIWGGEIGLLRVIRGGFTFNIQNPEDVRLNPSLGGGSIWDVGCYPISYARAVVGADPAQVFGWQVTGASGVDEVFAGQMRFANGVYAQFDSGFRAPERMLMEFVGSTGTITLANAFKPGLESELLLCREGGTPAPLMVPGAELYLGEIEDMADAILLGKAPRIGLSDSRGNVATILALLESARQGRPISVGASH
jgi:D-xylose 1-dehydrogenase (NADP+, D-xylono-1,5-lactone-forming)